MVVALLKCFPMHLSVKRTVAPEAAKLEEGLSHTD